MKKILNPFFLSLFLYVFYFLYILITPTISPEIGLAYLYLVDISSLTDIFKKFIVFNEEWYRPFTFYLTNKIIFSIVDIRNIYAVKIIGLLIIGILGWLATLVSKKLLQATTTERAILFCLVISHPVYYMIAYDGSGITDPFFNIFILLFILFFSELLEQGHGKNRKNIILIFLSILMIVLCLMSQERGAAIFLVLISMLICPPKNCNVLISNKIRSEVLVVCLASLIILVMYIKFVYFAKQGWSGPDYRSSIEIKYIATNLIRMFEFPLRLMIIPINKIYDVHLNVTFNILGVILILSTVIFFIGIFFGFYVTNKKNIFLVFIIYISTCVVPVFFGGNSWHFFTGSIFISMIQALGLNQVLLKGIASRVRYPILISIYAFTLYSIPMGISQEVGSPSHVGGIMQLVYRALHDERILSIADMEPEVIYFDTGDYGDNMWAFGGKGNLFKFIYQNPKLIEIPISNGKIINGYQYLCKNIKESNNPFFFKFNANDLSWSFGDNKEYCKYEK